MRDEGGDSVRPARAVRELSPRRGDRRGLAGMGDVNETLQVIMAKPRGFCAGVERAIDIVERALTLYGPPVYVRHEIVHNKRVVETLKTKGAVFVSEVDEVPVGAVAVFSAHGVARRVEERAETRSLEVIDATCPLVTKVHKEGRRYAAKGYDVVLIGHRGHPEVEGTLGQIPGRVHVLHTVEEVDALEAPDPERIAYVTQTTLSVNDTREVIDALQARFPKIVGPDTRDICYATQNRQQAVIEISRLVDLLLVVGAENSSNSNRLREIGELHGVTAHLIGDADALDPSWLDGVARVGLTAGASAPETLVQEVVARLKTLRPVTIEEYDGVEENVRFALPTALADVPTASDGVASWGETASAGE